MSGTLITHNSVSLDGSFIDFPVDMELHYGITAGFDADAHLIGSVTARTGLEMYGGEIPPEEEHDFTQPQKSPDLPYWVLVDTKGTLQGRLHALRRFEFCRDVIVVASRQTPSQYLDYLEERNYGCIISGDDHADLAQALSTLSHDFGIATVLADTGKTLLGVLLNKQLVDTMSLLVHPVILGERSSGLFADVVSQIDLKMIHEEPMKEDYLWVQYQVQK